MSTATSTKPASTGSKGGTLLQPRPLNDLAAEVHRIAIVGKVLSVEDAKTIEVAADIVHRWMRQRWL